MRTHHRRTRARAARLARRASLASFLRAALGVGLGSLTFAGHAWAQPIDETPPLPDVLLLLDTSGSMELMMDGCNPDTGLYPDGSGGGNCNGTISCVALGSNCTSAAPYCDGKTARSANRWGAEVAALTGDFVNPAAGGSAYSCLSMPRYASSAFANEYELQYSSGTSIPPYDLNYYLNYHRPVENLSATTACAYGFVQGTSGWNADSSSSHQENPAASPPTPDFQAAAIQGYIYDTTTMKPVLTAGNMTPCPSGFVQDEDGLINYGLNSIRFAMMSIDSDSLPNTGVTVTSDNGNVSFNDVGASFMNTAASGGASPSSGTPTTGMWSYFSGWESGIGTATVGRPGGCPEGPSSNQIFFEVGARNPAAPPWEGRMMRFPSAKPNVAPGANNSQIMQAIRVMRPFGANPIAGMMDDAKYYFWSDPQGPQAIDPYATCRQQYIILLSHAAPNDDLQPYCQGTAGGNVGYCPYDYPEYIAQGLAAGSYAPGAGVKNAKSAAASGPAVKTFVVGFALDSSLGDAGEQASCSQILTGPVGSQTINTAPGFCGTPDTNGAGTGTAGNPVYASCCALARIANLGGTQVPYFADTQDDLQKAFQAILAIIVSNASTRAAPVLLPQAASASSGSGPSAALFISSFTPSATSPWSGDVQRERYQCKATSGIWGPQQQPVTVADGDDFSYNLQQTQGTTRNVMMVEPYPQPGQTSAVLRQGGANIRPWVNGSKGTDALSIAFDGYTQYDGADVGFSYTTTGNSDIGGSAATYQGIVTPDVLFPTACTYKQGGATSAFSNADCETIALGYALGMQNPPASWNKNLSPFPTRYYTPGSTPPTTGPFGGVLNSTPAIESPPNALLKDDSYQAYTQTYATSYTTLNGVEEPRHTVLYVATLDGLLHAFGVDYNPNQDTYTFIGSGHASEGGTSGLQNELWSFIPPAVLPKLMTGVGGGETVLLDGAPVVRDVVYQRTSVGTGEDWHSALVAGFGSAGPGYYALDVTDPSFANRGSGSTSFGPAHSAANSNTPPSAGTAGGYMGTNGRPAGPHFLWQLTDTNLFAPNAGTPAITTVSIVDPDSKVTTPTEIAVAILPGGSSTPGSTTLSCSRLCNGAACSSTATKISDASPLSPPKGTVGYPLSSSVREWATSGGCADATHPARGRSLTVVRLDTGEVLRTFTPFSDVPSNFALFSPSGTAGALKSNAMLYSYQGRVTQAEFDSPISGTPVPYPSEVGAIAQRVFVGDQDGTIWRLDVSNTDPDEWFVEPFFDAYNATVQGTGATPDVWANQKAPIVLAPSVSVGRDGNVVLNFGTGDTTAIGTAANQNFVYSVTELPVAGARTLDNLFASVNWYETTPELAAGEMVTGPAAVFDGTYYFATYAPASTTNACAGGTAYLWGMDYTIAADVNGDQPVNPENPPLYGGVSKMLDSTNHLVQRVAQGSAIIPGITITSTATCAQAAASTDPATGGPLLSMSNVSPASYQVSALQGKSGASQGNNTTVSQVNVAMSVHTSTLIDSWASIVE